MSRYLTNRGNYVVRGPFEHYLDTNGDGTGTFNAIGDYSATPTEFYYAPPAGITAVISKLIIHIADKGLFGFDGYGAIAAGQVVNGMTITVERLGVEVLSLTNGVPITDNASMSHLNVDYNKTTFANNEESSSVSLEDHSFGGPLNMHGDLGDRLIVTLNDSFVGLIDHHFILYGTIGQ